MDDIGDPAEPRGGAAINLNRFSDEPEQLDDVLLVQPHGPGLYEALLSSNIIVGVVEDVLEYARSTDRYLADGSAGSDKLSSTEMIQFCLASWDFTVETLVGWLGEHYEMLREEAPDGPDAQYVGVYRALEARRADFSWRDALFARLFCVHQYLPPVFSYAFENYLGFDRRFGHPSPSSELLEGWFVWLAHDIVLHHLHCLRHGVEMADEMLDERLARLVDDGGTQNVHDRLVEIRELDDELEMVWEQIDWLREAIELLGEKTDAIERLPSEDIDPELREVLAADGEPPDAEFLVDRLDPLIEAVRESMREWVLPPHRREPTEPLGGSERIRSEEPDVDEPADEQGDDSDAAGARTGDESTEAAPADERPPLEEAEPMHDGGQIVDAPPAERASPTSAADEAVDGEGADEAVDREGADDGDETAGDDGAATDGDPGAQPSETPPSLRRRPARALTDEVLDERLRELLEADRIDDPSRACEIVAERQRRLLCGGRRLAAWSLADYASDALGLEPAEHETPDPLIPAWICRVAIQIADPRGHLLELQTETLVHLLYELRAAPLYVQRYLLAWVAAGLLADDAVARQVADELPDPLLDQEWLARDPFFGFLRRHLLPPAAPALDLQLAADDTADHPTPPLQPDDLADAHRAGTRTTTRLTDDGEPSARPTARATDHLDTLISTDP